MNDRSNVEVVNVKLILTKLTFSSVYCATINALAMRTPEFIKQHIEEDWDGFKIACCCKDLEKTCLKEAEELLKQNQ